MDILHGLLLNYYFLSFIIAWIVTTVLKALIHSAKHKKKFNIKDGFENGGMPSSHSAVVASLTMALFLRTGLSEMFYVSLVFSSIVISDAFKVRQNIGIQGEKLNELLKRFNENPIEVVYGHTVIQVITGIMIGIICAAALYPILL